MVTPPVARSDSKDGFTLNPPLINPMNVKRKLLAASVTTCLLCTQYSVTGKTNNVHLTSSGHSVQYSDSIVVEKKKTNRKHRIRLYPDANQKVLFFSANGNVKGNYQLFLFDMEGQLVRQASVKDNQVTLISKIPAGTYLFEVFTEDERLETGRVLVSVSSNFFTSAEISKTRN